MMCLFLQPYICIRKILFKKKKINIKTFSLFILYHLSQLLTGSCLIYYELDRILIPGGGGGGWGVVKYPLTPKYYSPSFSKKKKKNQHKNILTFYIISFIFKKMYNKSLSQQSKIKNNLSFIFFPQKFTS
jgi:hypothetical protein